MALLSLMAIGALLFASGGGSFLSRGMAAPWAVLGLTVLTVLCVSLLERHPAARARFSFRFWPSLLLLSLTVLTGVSVAALTGSDPGPGDGSMPAARDVARVREHLHREWNSLEQDLEAITALTVEAVSAHPDSLRGGDLFRTLENLRRQGWNADRRDGPFPLEAVVWLDRQRVAWTRAAVPLDAESVTTAMAGLARGRRCWVNRRLRALGAGMTLEFQIPLPAAVFEFEGVPLVWRVIPLEEASRLPVADPKGEPEPDVFLADQGNGLGLVLDSAPVARAQGMNRHNARIMLMAGTAWFLALLALARLAGGPALFLGAFWLGRGVLSGVAFFRWGAWAFPEVALPAAPERLVSLLDPAYFSTPFAFGFFASTLDALLTAVLLATTVGFFARWRGVAGRQDRSDAPRDLVLSLGQGPRTGLAFAGAGVLALAAVRFLGHLLATNANPRLIGEGVPLSFLSFWGLHLVLMLMGLAFFALLVSVTATRPWPGRGAGLSWAFASGLVLLVAPGLSWLLLDMRWAGHLLLGLVVTGLWLLTPAVVARVRFVRRFAWPAVLLVAAVWNYASLSEVYQRQELNWLRAKAAHLVEPSNPLAPFLLDEALAEMRQQDAAAAVPPGGDHDVWRDEAAYQLWYRSDLRDIGYPLLVEISDALDREESFFATGFMADANYQVLSRTLVSTADLPDREGRWGGLFEQEWRRYPDGDEWILRGRTERLGDMGWIRVELPLRSRRLDTQLTELTRRGNGPASGYRPRSEVDRPVLLLRGDSQGWLDVGALGIPGPESRPLLDRLRSGERPWARLAVGDETYLCLWQPLEPDAATSRNEGYLLGLRQPTLPEKLLDLSRLMLLNLVFLGGWALLVALGRGLRAGLAGDGARLSLNLPTGFQERFLSGYLFFGLLLLLAVGTAVDRMGHERIREEAATRTRSGLDTAVQQLRGLLVEQARSFSRSDYINELLIGQLAGERPVGELDVRQAMVFDEGGDLILDETLSDLTRQEADTLLAAGRTSPMIMMEDRTGLYVGTVIPIDLSGVLVPRDTLALRDGRYRNGYFLYRQQLDRSLLGGLADLVRGQATVRLDGVPVLASHPAGVFSGSEPLLEDPDRMATLLDHGQAAAVFAEESRPFAFRGSQPLPLFRAGAQGGFRHQETPAVLSLAFPDREREYAQQRRQTNLFLTGLANLILLTALLLALLMSWNLFRPLRLLLTATRSLARGDFHAPLPEAGRDEVGRLTSAFGGMRQELDQAREKLESRERFLSLVLERVTVGVAVLAADDRVVSLNPAGRQILAEFVPGADQAAGARHLRERFVQLAAGRARWGGEARSADGLRTVRGAMAPLDLPDGRVDTMVVFEDITEFLKTRKMAINAELARQVAHEIKNPLTPIQLSVQLLQQAWQDSHPDLDRIVPETTRRVLDQVELLRTIASEFSLLGRPGELERAPLDLPTLVRTTVDRYGAGNPQGAVGVDLQEATLPAVLAHEESLRKILGNLMQNSLDAVPADREPRIVVRWRVENERVVLLWADNGTGLDPEVADRLFDPYFSTKSKGTGLGLAICRNLADRMGGGIVLRNRPDGPGALAELSLPRHHPEGPAS
ncbi:hypothetical protein CSB20_10985 [bacterium DOLZORAL124_64_63]|nr:MAG: hypothetical protein CSB20_10985 [bacterium DOLZORAL124_64_63]